MNDKDLNQDDFIQEVLDVIQNTKLELKKNQPKKDV